MDWSFRQIAVGIIIGAILLVVALLAFGCKPEQTASVYGDDCGATYCPPDAPRSIPDKEFGKIARNAGQGG